MKRLHISLLSFAVYPLLAYFSGVRVFSLFLLSVFFHEAGHIFAIYFLHQRVMSITLTVGGLDIKRCGCSSYAEDALILICGPALGFCAGLAGYYLGYIDFFHISTLYTVFNLLPVYPLDGGHLLGALLYNCFDYEKAQRILKAVGLLFLFAVYVASILLLLFTEWNASLLFICVIIFSITFFQQKL